MDPKDPLFLIIEEIERIRSEIEQYESDISDCEVRIDFKPDKPRYLRLCEEKNRLMKNLADIRSELCAKGI